MARAWLRATRHYTVTCTFAGFQESTSWLNDDASLNTACIVATLSTDHVLRGRLKTVASRNVMYRFVTCESQGKTRARVRVRV